MYFNADIFLASVGPSNTTANTTANTTDLYLNDTLSYDLLIKIAPGLFR
jgi:hypothetical protein